MEEIKTILLKQDRFDLIALLENILDTVGYTESDEEYVPSPIKSEPVEEYFNAPLLNEEQFGVQVDEEGFHSLSFVPEGTKELLLEMEDI